jgi:hypothetical protein
MRNRNASERCCSYVVILDNAAASGSDLRDLATHLSSLGVANCDVVILDASARLQFELNSRILRWVGRHVAVRPEFRTPGGATDITRAAASLAACEKVIVAADDVRYTPEAIGQLCDLLDVHEVVEPQDYLEPMPWWGGIDAGRILVHRGIEPQPDHGATYAFRRSAVRAMRALGSSEVHDDQVRRLAAVGAEVHAATDVFVRREPAPLGDWLAARPRLAGDDFALPMKTAFFFSLMPMLLLLAFAGGLRLAGGYAGVIAVATFGVALRGRTGAATFFPLRAALFAPLWVFERSVSVYWALFQKLRGVEADPLRVAIPDAHGQRAASGE